MTLVRSLSVFFVALCAVKTNFAEGHGDGEECTHGKLYISDLANTTLHVVDLDAGFDNLTVSQLDIILQGEAPLYLDQAAGSLVVTAFDWGSDENFGTDGSLNLIHTGTVVEDDGDHSHLVKGEPYVIANADVSCAPVYNTFSHNGLYALSCDGSMEAEPPINTTMFVLDESLFSADATDPSALVATYDLQGSHHGWAIGLERDVVLHTIPTEDRVNGDVNASALASTFQTVDYDGNVLSTIDDETDPNNSCFDFHGVGNSGHTFAFACSHDVEQHGGVLIMDYDEETDALTSRAVMYPNTDLENHRSATIVGHSGSSMLISDFADWDAEVYAPHLLSIPIDGSALTADNVLELGTLGQCDYGFEQAEGKLVVVMLPSGVVQVYKADPTWELLVEQQVLQPADSCPWPVPFKVGYMSVFLYEGTQLFALDLHHVEDEKVMEVHTLELGFTPYSMTVAGVPEGFWCDHSDEEPENDQENDQENEENAVSGAVTSPLPFVGALLMSLSYVML